MFVIAMLDGPREFIVAAKLSMRIEKKCKFEQL